MCSDARFASDIEKGKFGEKIVMNWLDGYKTNYDNVTEDKAYQDIDIDFIVHSTQFDVNVEAKYQDTAYVSGALCIETVSSKSQCNLGWWKKSKADSFVFVVPMEDSDTYMLVKLKKSYLQEWIDIYKPKEMRMGNGKGYYIKLNDLNKYQPINKTIIEYVNEIYPKDRIIYYVKAEV